VVRIGGRSQSEKLKKRNLTELIGESSKQASKQQASKQAASMQAASTQTTHSPLTSLQPLTLTRD